MARPKFLGVSFAAKAQAVLDAWKRAAGEDSPAGKLAKAKVKALRTFEARAAMNPLSAGDFVARDRWPKCATRDYGSLPNLARFELPDNWRGIFSLVGEPGGVRIRILYLWDHPTYDKEFGYEKK